jgi:DNA repair protein RadA/Sms
VAAAQPITAVDGGAGEVIPTGIAEFDRVLGAGLVPGAVILLAGEPGVGKSTLLLEVASQFAQLRTGVGARSSGVESSGVVSHETSGTGNSGPVLYLTGEEAVSQVKRRAERIGAIPDDASRLLLAAETDLSHILGQIETVAPSLVIVDSVQTISSSEVDGAPGGVAQVREVAGALISAAKQANVPIILIGHVTKDGTVAGPRTLEHLVDVVLQFEGESHTRLRLLRALKNRYGPTDEIGCFELSEYGLTGFVDPSSIFMSQNGTAAAGSCITVSMEGRRPIALEIQALVAPGNAGNPRRATLGVESSRLAMLLAVLHRHAGIALADQEVYLSTVGGVRLSGPAGDLAAALAIVSSYLGVPLPRRFIAVGEVGLAGDIRAVPGLERRLSEAARLGFTHAIVPPGVSGVAAVSQKTKISLIEVTQIAQAIEAALGGHSGAATADLAQQTSRSSHMGSRRVRPERGRSESADFPVARIA